MSPLPHHPANAVPCTGCDHLAPSVDDTTISQEMVGRRTAIQSSVMAGVAALLGTALLDACATNRTRSGGTQGVATTSAGGLPVGRWILRVRASDFPELAKQGGYARVDGDSSKPVAVVRTASGYAAFSLLCTHAGGTLELVEGQFVCPRHGAKFSTDGAWTGGHRATNLNTLSVTEENGILTLSD